MYLDRRNWMAVVGTGVVGTVAGQAVGAEQPGGEGCPPAKGDLALKDFRPKSMLHVEETRVEKPRFPVVDVHTHFTFARAGRRGAAPDDAVAFNTTAKDALAVMDRKGLRAAVNLTGGFRDGWVVGAGPEYVF